jgi:hypothetical protein
MQGGASAQLKTSLIYRAEQFGPLLSAMLNASMENQKLAMGGLMCFLSMIFDISLPLLRTNPLSYIEKSSEESALPAQIEQYFERWEQKDMGTGKLEKDLDY